jgi:hypothetical protein
MPEPSQRHRVREKSKRQLTRALGLYAMEFVALESQVDISIGIFLRIPHEPHAIILTSAIFNVSTRLDILHSLVNAVVAPEKMTAELDSCLKEIRELNAYRNWILHNTWAGFEPPDTWPKARWIISGNSKWQNRPFTPTAIEANATKCKATKLKLRKLTKAWDAYYLKRRSSGAFLERWPLQSRAPQSARRSSGHKQPPTPRQPRSSRG